MKLSKKLKMSAEKKPLTIKPGIKIPASLTMAALMTNKNKPSVKTVMGIVKTTNMGLIKALINERMIATISAVKKPLTSIPGIR